ncbi:integrin alpha-PS4-like [Periplaneta americana]|uniref:integrin alpha-PS4-like n=1 Tax=Periplaneta americana TaxID=6978 RepID=UPI0037E76D78
MCVLQLLLVSWLALASGFNLDWRHAPVFQDPEGQDGSYFGFSVALRRQGFKQWLVVGAPRANSTYHNHDAIHQPGAVYQCPLDSRGDGSNCQRLLVDPGGNGKQQILPGSPVRQNRNDSWLGASVVAQGDGERLLVCAPRWRNTFHDNFYLMNGACYCTSDTSDPDLAMDMLLPLVQKNRQSLRVGPEEAYFYYAYGEAGFSAHMPQGAAELLLGAPGVYDWRGTVVRYHVGTLTEGKPRRRRRSSVDTFEPEVPNAQRGKQIPLNSYLGYSLSSGRFLSENSGHLYAAGAPRDSTYKGRVYVFDFPQDPEREDLDLLVSLDGTQMGEYFGAAITAVDMNGDGLDDLAVGAPLFSLTSADDTRPAGDEGRVYIFINKDFKVFTEVTEGSKLMGSRKHNARFGTALVNVGDLNLDGFEDLAVGAPYEDDGVVYIYHGHETGVNPRPAQELRAQQVDPRLRGLGMSLSRGFDVDGNHYNDLAAGAFDSGHAVLFRAHPVVSLRARLDTSRSSISLNSTGFTVTACLGFAGQHAPAVVESNVIMQVDTLQGRAQFRWAGGLTNNLTYMATLRKDLEDCRDLEVTLHSGDKDPTKPLDVVMHFRPARDPATAPAFCTTCPVVSPGDPDHVTKRVAFETGCARAVCRPDLVVTANFEGIGNTLVLGREPTLRLRVQVSNQGERAFLPRAALSLPRETPLARLPPSCQESKERSSEHTRMLLCDLGSPLERAATLEVALNAKDVALNTSRLRFYVNVTSAGDEENPRDNTATLTLGVAVQADMTISGTPSQDPLVYVAPNKTLKRDLVLNHTFDAVNLGPSRVGAARLLFEFPHQFLGPHGNDVFMEVLQPEARLQPSGALIPCHPLPPYAFWSPAAPPKDVDLDVEPTLPPIEDYDENEIEGSVSKRSLPEVEFPPSGSGLRDAPANRTLYLNCSNPQVDCVQVECSVEDYFVPDRTHAVVSFQLKPFFEVLEPTLAQEMKDIVLYASRGQVIMEQPPSSAQPENHKPDGVTVLSMFLGKAPEVSVASWIIAVAVICGILILFLIAMALHKMGFFHRAKKEELAALKAEDDMDGE